MHERSGETENSSFYKLQLAKARMVMSKLEELEIDSYGEFKEVKCGYIQKNY
ncbi:conserved Plasmodium protein, unknown function [Plasmodium ovale]|uniref:Uncharacterized protein n=1 Tax=Plasmodium ovale TaxID=36330 RepID=A0A1D3TGI0_PLAOA|nr:conserved Plasmodium protein, unknown function [Plasmodium ovale]